MCFRCKPTMFSMCKLMQSNRSCNRKCRQCKSSQANFSCSFKCCQHAHDPYELQAIWVTADWKTKPCTNKKCKDNRDCIFLHDDEWFATNGVIGYLLDSLGIALKFQYLLHGRVTASSPSSYAVTAQ